MEWIQAAWSDHLSFDEFQHKSGQYQSLIVAAYRAKNQIDAVLAEDRHIKLETERMAQEAARQNRPPH